MGTRNIVHRKNSAITSNKNQVLDKILVGYYADDSLSYVNLLQHRKMDVTM